MYTFLYSNILGLREKIQVFFFDTVDLAARRHPGLGLSFPGRARVTGISIKKSVHKYSCIFHYIILRTKWLPPLQNAAASGFDASGSSMPSMKYPVFLSQVNTSFPFSGALKRVSTLLVWQWQWEKLSA